jgi:tRNA-splicing ligase RtcB
VRVYDPKENGTRLPIKSWASILEDGALEQARNIANLPVSIHHVALMPDSHFGFGVPIGSVVFTDGAVIPNAVGVDVGCGVAMMPLGLTVDDLGDKLQATIDIIAARVPTGFRRHSKPVSDPRVGDLEDSVIAMATCTDPPVTAEWWNKAATSLGTLGGGNHFIEFQADEDDNVYVMLHSGSRGLGKSIGDFYHKMAVEECHRWHTQLPTDDLAFFPLGTPGWDSYMAAMNFGLAYAETNRRLMLEEVKIAVLNSWPNANPTVLVNVHHNYAAWENHFGQNGVVHRKGAIRARLGETLLIPGSMGTASYIGRGLGNHDSYDTCQHGAGRAMGRKDAERRYAKGDLENLETYMGSRGILMGGHASEAIDEHPGAYKPIDVVMADSADLVEPVTRLRPIAVLKG